MNSLPSDRAPVTELRIEDERLLERVSTRFRRREPRETMRRYVDGLLDPTTRKNGWGLSVAAGDPTPDAMQRLVRTANWSVDEVRDDVRSAVVERLGRDDVLWIVDEAAFVKRGHASAGATEQYMRVRQRRENCQVGVFLIYATSRDEALVDRELFIPPVRGDEAGGAALGHEENTAPGSKPALARLMLERAYDAGLLGNGWVTADKTYGATPDLRRWLDERGLASVMATANDDIVTVAGRGPVHCDALVDEMLDGRVPLVDGWRVSTIAAGPYAGETFDWAAVELDERRAQSDWKDWLLVRRQKTPSPGSHYLRVAYYRCSGPADTGVATLIDVAAGRWRSESAFQSARENVGLDQYQVRHRRGWYAHVTLSMLAAAIRL